MVLILKILYSYGCTAPLHTVWDAGSEVVRFDTSRLALMGKEVILSVTKVAGRTKLLHSREHAIPSIELD